MRRSLCLVLSGALAFGSACSFSGAERFANADSSIGIISDQKKLEELINSTYKLRQDSTYSETLVDKDNRVLGVTYHKKGILGSAFAFGRTGDKTYFATADHCLAKEPEEKEKEQLGGIVKSRFALHQTTIKLVNYTKDKEEVIAELKEVARNNDSDTAILEGINLDPEQFKVYSYFIDPSLVRQGQFIYSIGFPQGPGFSWGRHLTQGIVSSLDTDQLPFNSKGIIFTEAILDPGMSGGPSYVVRNGVPLIAGVNVRMYTPNLHGKYGISLGLIELIKKTNLEHLIMREQRPSVLVLK